MQGGAKHERTLRMLRRKPRRELRLMQPTKASVMYCTRGHTTAGSHRMHRNFVVWSGHAVKCMGTQAQHAPMVSLLYSGASLLEETVIATLCTAML